MSSTLNNNCSVILRDGEPEGMVGSDSWIDLSAYTGHDTVDAGERGTPEGRVPQT